MEEKTVWVTPTLESKDIRETLDGPFPWSTEIFDPVEGRDVTNNDLS